MRLTRRKTTAICSGLLMDLIFIIRVNPTDSCPVDVKITYYLDGQEIAPENLAGKSGKVKIRFDYTNNSKKTVKVNGKEEEIYTPFLMASGMILPGDNFKNVEVSNGKVISDGSNNIVVGIALPGLEDSLKLDELDLGDRDEIPVMWK